MSHVTHETWFRLLRAHGCERRERVHDRSRSRAWERERASDIYVCGSQDLQTHFLYILIALSRRAVSARVRVHTRYT